MSVASELDSLLAVLRAGGVHAALSYLNARTPHRFTGVYRYDGEILRNVALYDRFQTEVRMGADIPMKDAYCADVGRLGKSLVFADARVQGANQGEGRGVRFEFKPAVPIISYCGVLLRDEKGDPFGTLCHYDMKPCQPRISDVPLLEAAAPFIFSAVNDNGQAPGSP